ncbi:hypothetical protein PPYR_09115 [Photinus pyralis]|uniref:Uncharacterized protein n=1 Tax=Photinus pyralis TaxID=7054 RepID=A0A5N4AKR3_PHOPY|nr:hypothetical protein PPYR_08900 [Photinus pyralis]KAB0798122.1 hypothetical protein PPYR_09115 [Photinus pyralis]
MPLEESMELLKSLKNKRRNLKSSLTRFHTYVSEFTESPDIFELKSRLGKAEHFLNDFENVQSQIECLEDTDETAQSEEFENSFFKVLAKARNIIENYRPANDTIISNTQSNSNFNVKLPTMHLPEFDGSYDKWMGFCDTFDALVNKNDSLTQVQRFYYLKSALKGEAAHLLNSLEVTESNYEIAWELLRERYENKKLIISTHVKHIFELPCVIKDNHKSLRSLIDNFNKHLRSLTNLKLPTDKWDILLIYILTNKLDSTTKHEWEKISVNNAELPTLSELSKFLVERCHILEKMSGDSGLSQLLNKKGSSSSHLATSTLSAANCYYCKRDHQLFRCPEFLKLSVQNRWVEIKKLKLCANCFRPNHFNTECRSSYCRKCNRNHNTVLHNSSFERINSENSNNKALAERNPNSPQPSSQTHLAAITTSNNSIITAHSYFQNHHVILSTATIHIRGARGKLISCRALLDSGSQSNFITSELLEKLDLQGSKISIRVSGVDKSITNVNRQVTTEISSIHNVFKRELSFLVLRDITGNVPINDIDISTIKIPNGIKLADQSFNVSGKIDVLLGAGVFWNLLCIGQIKLDHHNAIFQKTTLGWVFAGAFLNTDFKQEINSLHSATQDVQEQLENFWRIEECETKRNFTKEELYCEQHFITNFKRDFTGRFEVRLPMRDENFDFKNSIDNATRRFISLEKRFARDPEFKRDYQTFIHEYESLGHMSEVKPELHGNSQRSIFYLPHHGVIKNSSTTTKLRVVFDASCKSSSGHSLNEKLCVGPHIQDDLFSIIIRFRKHNIIYTADIAKMYRQINVADDQRDLQRIVWRNFDYEPLKHYRLNTITYGTAPASFLAMRCLQQLGNENMQKSPKASSVILNDFYMDDLITGTDTIQDAIKTKNEVNAILEGAGFQLRQWTSNHKVILNQSDVKRNVDQYYISDDKETKTLGLMWDTCKDTIGYSLSNVINEKITKRTILSMTAKIYDPLGLLGPVTIKIKIILQRLWQERLGWDESVPFHIYTEWNRILSNLKEIENIRLPRQVTIENYSKLELHGFCDASEAAYACCIYIRSSDKEGNIKSRLLCAKSRVAPLKAMTIPRLELSAAVLLSNLMYKVINSFNAKFERVCYWSDSMISLSWIKSNSMNFQVFVANRIAEIQKFSNPLDWYHVKSGDNPADIISRGLNPEMLVNNTFWWEGPIWLKGTTYNIETITKINELPETRKNNYKILAFTNMNDEFHFFKRYSNITKLQRVLAYSLRFINNISTHKNNKIAGELTVYPKLITPCKK